MKERIFDEVTKALAMATSRRQALRRIGGILGGTALAGLVPGLALANNSGAAHFCKAIFDPGPDRGQCISDAAHGTGLYYNSSCGGNPQSVCCPTNPDGTCSSYSSATCCGSGQTCSTGTCVAACAGVVLSNGSCAQTCPGNGPPTGCTCSSAVICETDTDGYSVCSTGNPTNVFCRSDSVCPIGTYCSPFLSSCVPLATC